MNETKVNGKIDQVGKMGQETYQIYSKLLSKIYYKASFIGRRKLSGSKIFGTPLMFKLPINCDYSSQ